MTKDEYLTNYLRDDIIDFQSMVERLAEVMSQEPEEVIRALINGAGYDIRECLNYKDIVSIVESEAK